jgi:hypothetical protein
MFPDIKDILKDIASDPMDERRKDAIRKSINYRKCTCGHNFGKHSDPVYYELMHGSPQATETNPCAECDCQEFIHVKANPQPCKCGHDKRYHVESILSSGKTVLRCKYCQSRCPYFRLVELTEMRDVTPSEQHATVKASRQRAIDSPKYRAKVLKRMRDEKEKARIEKYLNESRF